MSLKGRLFVFEGPDGAGKSALCAQFLKTLSDQGVNAHSYSFPGQTPHTIGQFVYQLHHAPNSFGIKSISASSLQNLHIAAHLDAIETNILPHLRSGGCIILDRFWWSTWAYGAVGGVRMEILDAMIEVERLAWEDWLPTNLFYVDRSEPLRPEPAEIWLQLKKYYERLISQERGKYPITTIKNNCSIAESLEQTLAEISL